MSILNFFQKKVEGRVTQFIVIAKTEIFWQNIAKLKILAISGETFQNFSTFDPSSEKILKNRKKLHKESKKILKT
jgi:hypothetical protein